MKLYLYGHDYKYAAEQMLLTLFPAQRPEYPAGPPAPGEDALVLSLHRGAVWATATAALSYGGREYRAARRCRTAELTDPLSTDRALQRILKLAFYDAGTAARGGEPPWGALTGVRPVKIPTKAMLAGAGPAQAERLLRDTYRVTEGRRRLAMDCAGASLAALRSLAPGEVSLYVGIPFCPTRCAYCSFVSADVGRALKLIDPFLDALCRELAATGAMLADAGLRVRTVYFGGGTPTTLSAPQLDRLMGELADHIDLSGCTEYTVEAGRPDTITAEKLAVLARRGCSRVSVNPQTMQDAVLERMGRAHRADDILRAYALARESGIGCINMDLIAGLPGDSAEGFRASLEQVLDLGPENVTVHTLALKKGSRLMEEGGGLPSGAAVADMLDFAWAALRGAGQRPYYLYRQKYMSGSFENVGWCRPGAESLYNICMMEELHTIVSLGGGGVTKLVDRATGYIERLAMLADAGLRVRTVYFGGGTPTTLSAPQLDRLMGELADHIDLSGCTEYTVEAGRPDTITAEKLAVLARRGCSRVSVNPQTMQDAVLERMGRAHRADDILRAYALARESGIGCINMDLIAGLPGDSAEGFRASLEQVLDLGPENVTVHTLALKKGSRLMEEGGGLPSGAAVADMLDFAWAALRGAGQRPYYLYRQKYMSGSFENVGWCRPGAESLYNICMMEELHTIVSLGGGGVTKLVDRATGYIERLANAKYPQEYIQKIDAICADKGRVAQFYAAHGR